MKISHFEDFDTHAILGGGETQAFQIAQTAEFFTVLSSTLYRDKKRAVVREVICNAWDAHIAAGIKDRPVEITITDTEITVRDYGAGIPHDQIGPIYCVYGASTKVDSQNQTGGFGLGCKAPFAYSDHFTVTSCHDGIKGVYPISRGGSETQGIPDWRCMVRIPTEDTGVIVSIPLRSKHDGSEFQNLVRSVVLQGGINATLNGTELYRIKGWDAAFETGFMLLNHGPSFLFGGPGEVYLAYGAVSYPIETTDHEIRAAIAPLRNILKDKTLVLFAKPDTIGITPSREGLSYTDRTKKELLRLVNRAYKQISQHIQKARFDRDVAFISDRGMRAISNLYWFHPVELATLPEATSDPYQAARILLKAPSVPIDRKHYKAIGTALPAFRPLLARGYSLSEARVRIDTRLFLRLAQKAGVLDHAYCYYSEVGFYPIRRYFATKDVPGKTVVIAPNQRDARKAIKEAELDCCFTLIIPRITEAQRARIKEVAGHLQFNWIEVERTKAPRKKKPAEADFIHLHDAVNKSTVKALTRAPLTGEEKYSLLAETYSANHELRFRLVRFDPYCMREVQKLYPNSILVTGLLDHNRAEKAGLKSAEDAFLAEVDARMKSRLFLYTYAIHHAELSTRIFGHTRAPQVACYLARLDLRLARLVLPFPVRVTEKNARDEPLAILAAESHQLLGRERREAIREAARKELPFLRSGVNVPENLALLAINHLDHADRDELIALVKYLLRNHQKN